MDEYRYAGAPDECSPCFVQGRIVRLVNGDCPSCAECLNEEELWFGAAQNPFRFQGEMG